MSLLHLDRLLKEAVQNFPSSWENFRTLIEESIGDKTIYSLGVLDSDIITFDMLDTYANNLILGYLRENPAFNHITHIVDGGGFVHKLTSTEFISMIESMILPSVPADDHMITLS